MTRHVALMLASAVLLITLGFSVWVLQSASKSVVAPQPTPDELARRYVTLALAVGQHSPDDIDAYYGPAELRPAAGVALVPLSTLQQQSQQLLALARDAVADSPRKQRLLIKLAQLQAVINLLLTPRQLNYADEARLVYAVEVSETPNPDAASAIRKLDRLLAGPGPLSIRVQSYRDRYRVPAEKRKALFERALQECRKRTLAHWNLPADESLSVEWTRSTGAAWHRYAGRHHSVLQINPDALAYEESAVDIACHEGYPGHHAQFVMQDISQSSAGFEIEDSVVLLRTADAVHREGAAEYGVQLAFPLEDRVTFERDVLFPIAGLKPAEAAKHVRVMQLIRQIAPSVSPIVAGYRDGRISRAEAQQALQSSALSSSPVALLDFVDRYGAYATGYTVARDRVQRDVETAQRRPVDERWQSLLQQLLESMPLRVVSETAGR
jgi:hypothetical protein